MLICAPFHSTASPPVGMAYLRSYLEASGITTDVLDLNIRSRRHLMRTDCSDLVPEMYSQSCRTYLAEAMAWSWLHEDGASAIVQRAVGSSSPMLREHWRGIGIERLITDPALHRASEQLREWLLDQARAVVRAGARWVGFSTVITNLAATLYLTRSIKEMEPEILIALGGPETTDRNAEEMLRSFPWIDAAIPAPAYEPLQRLISCFLAGGRPATPLPGMALRLADGRIAVDSSRLWVPLDEMPFASWTGFDLTEYDPGLFATGSEDPGRWRPTISLHTAQGCSYNACDFCYNTTIYPVFAAQSPARVVREIEHQTQAVGSRGFFFTDLELNASVRRVKELCRLLQRLPYEIRFYAWLRLDKIDQELLELIFDAGGRQLFIGVEAVDDDLLHLMRKGYNARSAVGVLQVLDEFCATHPELRFAFNLIKSYPNEQLHSVKQTLECILEHPQLFRGRVAAVVEFMLHEGTPVYHALAPDTVGCLTPLLPEGATLRSYQHLYESRGDHAADRAEIWSAITTLVGRNA